MTEVYGFIKKDTRVEQTGAYIRRVSVKIGVVGRILRYDDVLYYTSGSSGVDVRIRDVADPEGLAAEAETLAKRRQGKFKEAGKRTGDDVDTVQPGHGAGADPQILNAFSGSVAERIEVQREVLNAIQGLRAETRQTLRFFAWR